jgi:integrase
VLVGKSTNKLEALQLKRGLPPGRHWDGEGLYLEVPGDSSAAYWRLKYRFGGKEKRISLGVYPTTSLAEARKARAEAKALLHRGVDPSAVRKAEQVKIRVEKDGTFGAVAERWLLSKTTPQKSQETPKKGKRRSAEKVWSDDTRRKARLVLDNYLLPKFRNHSIATLATKEVAPVLREMSTKVPDLARKARQYVNGIIVYAIHDGLRDDDRLLSLEGAVLTSETTSIPAATLPEEIAVVLKKILSYNVEVTRAALLMCAYTAQRPGIVVAMKWADLVLEAREWRIPARVMKTRHFHIVPLSRQVLQLIEDMRKYTGGKEYVFPPLARQKNVHLHRDTLSKALRDLGLQGKQALHGFRATLRTTGPERLDCAENVLEAQLAHAKKGNVQKAYDRTRFDDKRKLTMQEWADWLDALVKPPKKAKKRTASAASR